MRDMTDKINTKTKDYMVKYDKQKISEQRDILIADIMNLVILLNLCSKQEHYLDVLIISCLSFSPKTSSSDQWSPISNNCELLKV